MLKQTRQTLARYLRKNAKMPYPIKEVRPSLKCLLLPLPLARRPACPFTSVCAYNMHGVTTTTTTHHHHNAR